MGHFMYPDKKWCRNCFIFRNYFIFHTQASCPAGSAKAQAPCPAGATQAPYSAGTTQASCPAGATLAACQAAGSALASWHARTRLDCPTGPTLAIHWGSCKEGGVPFEGGVG